MFSTPPRQRAGFDQNPAVLGSPGAAATIRLTDAKGVFVRGCRPGTGTELFLNLQGPQSERVVLMANDFSGVRKIVETGPDVAKTALAQRANYPAQE